MHQVIGFELDDHSASSLMVNGGPYNPYNWPQYGKRSPIPSALQSLLLINPPPLHTPPSASPQKPSETVQREEAIVEEAAEEEAEAEAEAEEEGGGGKWVSAVLPCSPPHNPIPRNLHIVSTDDGFTHLAIEEELKKKLQYCHCPHLNSTRFHQISSSSFPSLNDEYNDDMEEKEEFSNDDDGEEEEEEEFSMKSPLFDEGNAGCYNHRQRSSIASKNNNDILQSCYLCKSFLCHSQDIFMYRGDRAFCSAECRQQHIAVDEISKPNTPIMLRKGLIFHPMKRRVTTATAA